MELARDSRILDIVEIALGPNIQLYYSMVFMKPPSVGNNSPWHQDFSFYAHTRADLVHVQIYFDDSTFENGCLRIVPGSRKLCLLNHFKDGVFTGELQGDTSQYDEQEIVLPNEGGRYGNVAYDDSPPVLSQQIDQATPCASSRV